MIKVIGIGEMATSMDETVILKTYALSSCVAVVVHSSLKQASGIIHVALPTSTNKENIDKRPCYYAKSGIPLLIESMCAKYGCLKGELQISLYGGANTGRQDDTFHIGQKNLKEAEKTLQKMQLHYQEGDVGGVLCRTLEMKVNTGMVTVFPLPLML